MEVNNLKVIVKKWLRSLVVVLHSNLDINSPFGGLRWNINQKIKAITI